MVEWGELLSRMGCDVQSSQPDAGEVWAGGTRVLNREWQVGVCFACRSFAGADAARVQRLGQSVEEDVAEWAGRAEAEILAMGGRGEGGESVLLVYPTQDEWRRLVADGSSQLPWWERVQDVDVEPDFSSLEDEQALGLMATCWGTGIVYGTSDVDEVYDLVREEERRRFRDGILWAVDMAEGRSSPVAQQITSMFGQVTEADFHREAAQVLGGVRLGVRGPDVADLSL